MDMSIGMLDHYNVSTRKLKETVQFYEDVLGFKNGPRPQFDFPGAWLYSGSQPVLHLNDIAHTDRQQPADSGVIDHVAFGSRGFEAMKKHLERQGRALPRQPGAQQHALADLFPRSQQCRDRAQFRDQERDGGLSFRPSLPRQSPAAARATDACGRERPCAAPSCSSKYDTARIRRWWRRRRRSADRDR